MTKVEAWSLLLQALGLFGGGAAVTIAIAAFLSKIIADRSIEKHKAQLGQETERLKGELAKETETHKLNLRKQELLFTKQIDAVSEFLGVSRKLRPNYDRPEKEWDEACDELANELDKVETTLEEFRQKNGPVLDKEAREIIKKCISLASINKFAASGAPYGSMREASKAAGEIMEALEELEDYLLDWIQK